MKKAYERGADLKYSDALKIYECAKCAIEKVKSFINTTSKEVYAESGYIYGDTNVGF